MSEDPADPPRKFYGLKPREFDAVNGPPRDLLSDTQPTGPDPGVAATNTGPITVQDLNLAAAGAHPALGVNGPVNRANDVHTMLDVNRRNAQAAGEFELTYQPPRPSRRNRDFWILALATNGGILGFMGLIGGFDAAMLLFGLGAGLMLTAGLGWVMYFVMDKY